MPNFLRSFCLSVLLVILAAPRVAAQTEAAAELGEVVRFQIVGPSAAPVGKRCSGRATSAALDTLIVSSVEDCSRGSYLANLQVVRGDRGSRWTHVGYGALAGGVVGAVLMEWKGKQCNGRTCVDGERGNVSGGRLLAGALAGALPGGVVGFVFPAGPVWVRAGLARPLRVVGPEALP
jgi:hypothetical protein